MPHVVRRLFDNDAVLAKREELSGDVQNEGGNTRKRDLPKMRLRASPRDRGDALKRDDYGQTQTGSRFPPVFPPGMGTVPLFIPSEKSRLKGAYSPLLQLPASPP